MPPAEWSLRLLGPAEIAHGGATLLLQAKRPHQLLAYLAARADWVRREQLAALFWPERGEAAARSNLRKVILLAHQELNALAPARSSGVGRIEDHAGALRWHVPTDAHTFVQHASSERHDDAIALYRGPFLQGLDDEHDSAFNEWLAFERARLAERWRACVLRVAETCGSPARCADLAARLLARDPLDEAALRLQLGALAALGRQADARRALAGYARRLLEETGLEVSADLQATCEPATGAPAPRADGGAFFGRGAELLAISHLIGATHAAPLLLVGPGGIGKSRLLREAVRRFGQRLAHGAVYVDLQGVHAGDVLAERIARALALPLVGSADPWDALRAPLQRRALLLALDSFDLLGSAARSIERLQAQCPGLRIVISSRVRPALSGARTLGIDGLTCPPPDDGDVAAFDAVQLFTHHARRARPDFDLADEAPAVAEICRLVDGLPLALQLAAGWVRLFRCTDIASDLRRDLALLNAADTEGTPGVAAILEQSWSLLVPHERRTLALLAVFHGPFDQAAVRAVSGASLAVIGALIDKSLLRSEGDARLSLHPLVQRFAWQRLQAGDGACDEAQARRRHAEHYANLLEGLGQPVTDHQRCIAVVGIDLENFRAAWRTHVEAGDAAAIARCISALSDYHLHRGPQALALQMLDEAEPLLLRASPPQTAALHGLLRWRALLCYRMGEMARAEANLQRARELPQAELNSLERRRRLNIQGVVAWARGDLRVARGEFEQALVGAESDGDSMLGDLLGNLGLIALAEGRDDEARQCFADALAQHRRFGNTLGEVQQLLNLGSVCSAQRQWREVLRLMGEGLALARTIDYAEHRPYGLRMMGMAHLELGDTAAARNCIHSALALIDDGAEPMHRGIALTSLAAVELAEGRLDAAETVLRDAALHATAGALAHDRVGLICIWSQLLFAQGRTASAAILGVFAAAHPSLLPAERPQVQALLERLRNALTPEVFTACSHKATQLELDALLSQAATLLAPEV
jgi:predicted ATPase/DNA-binding SARP family transcriptional activator/Tfp pilus assembly protein PilF